MKLTSETSDGMEFVTVEGTIESVGLAREITIGEKPRTVTEADAVLKDDSGQILLQVQEFQIQYLTPGTRIRVEYAFVKSKDGKLRLELPYGRIINLLEST